MTGRVGGHPTCQGRERRNVDFFSIKDTHEMVFGSRKNLNFFRKILYFLIFPLGLAHGTEKRFVSHPKTEATLLGIGVPLLGVGTFLTTHTKPPSSFSRDSDQIFFLDRFAIHCHSSSADRVGNMLFPIAVGFPFFFSKPSSFHVDFLMNFEAHILSQGLVRICKGLFPRPRPYVYQTSTKISERSAFQSFFSGHTTSAFTGAVLAGVIYQRSHLKSTKTKWVWISGLAIASGVAIARVASGEHYLTDVLVGAGIGTISGMVVASLHWRNPE